MASSLSADTKDALARDVPEESHCRHALLAGLVIYGAERGRFTTRRNAVARLFRTLSRERGERAGHVAARDGKHAALSVPVPPELVVPHAKPTRRCDRIAEVRAAFLAGGSLAAAAHGYHLEFVPGDTARAERLALLLRSLGCEAKQMTRKGRTVLYYKDFDAISDALTTMGAFGAVLRLEDARALRETKNRIHRLVNTEAANVERAAAAAAGQLHTIRYLASAYGLQNLTPALREIAQARLAHPEETLTELGRRCDPEIGKPTVNSRLGALVRLERRLRSGGARANAGKVARRGVR